MLSCECYEICKNTYFEEDMQMAASVKRLSNVYLINLLLCWCQNYPWSYYFVLKIIPMLKKLKTLSAFTCSKLMIETVEQGVKYAQS